MTKTIVWPCLCSAWKISIIWLPVFVSRLPVGSSVRSSAGLLISARAMATRCRSPPDSFAGLWFILSCRFISVSSWIARNFVSFLHFCQAKKDLPTIAGMMTFSSAVSSGRRW